MEICPDCFAYVDDSSMCVVRHCPYCGGMWYDV